MDSFLIDIFHKLTLGIILIDEDQTILIWNQWMEKKTELKAENVLGKNFYEVCPQFYNSIYINIIETVRKLGQGRFLSGSLHGAFFKNPLKESSGQSLHNLQMEQVILDNKKLVLIQVIDVTSQYQMVHQMKSFIRNLEVENDEIRQAEIEARKLAMHDTLTGLPNRLNFMSQLTKVTKESNVKNAAVIFLDIDNFKYINDTYGHPVGDILLQLTAQRLKAATRATDLVARLSGDEFTVLLFEISKKDAVSVANKIIKQFSAPFEINEIKMPVTCSFGISMYPADGTDALDLIDKADIALYRVKNEEKAGYEFYS